MGVLLSVLTSLERPTLNPLVTACHVVMAGLFTAAASGALGSQVLLSLLAAIAVYYVVARLLYHLKIVDFPFKVFLNVVIGPLLFDHR